MSTRVNSQQILIPIIPKETKLLTWQATPKSSPKVHLVDRWQTLPSSNELPGLDDRPVDDELHTLIPHFLRKILREFWEERTDWFFGINMNIYHTTGNDPKTPIVADSFLCLNVPPRNRQGSANYVVWEENEIVPILVIELVSHIYRHEYDTKMLDYAHLGVLYYVVYNPHYFKRDEHEPFEVYRLEAGKYVRYLGKPVLMPEIGLGIGASVGSYQRWWREWLYWYTQEETRLSISIEQTQRERRQKEQALQQVYQEQRLKEQALQQIQEERQQKEQALQQLQEERQQKEQALQRAEHLTKLLQEMGVDPNHFR